MTSLRMSIIVKVKTHMATGRLGMDSPESPFAQLRWTENDDLWGGKVLQ